MNTNKGFILQSDAEPLTRELKIVIDRMMANVLDYISCKEMAGEKSYQPHAHIMIAISHYTKVKVDYAKLKSDVKEASALKRTSTSTQSCTETNAEIADYMAKTVRK